MQTGHQACDRGRRIRHRSTKNPRVQISLRPTQHHLAAHDSTQTITERWHTRAASARHPAHGPSSALCYQSRHAPKFFHRAGPAQTAESPTSPRDPPAAHRSGHKSTPCADPQDARSSQAPPDARASRARLRSNPCLKVSRATIRHRHAHHPHAASRSTHWQIGETKTDPQAAGSRRRCSPLPLRPSRRIRRKITDCQALAVDQLKRPWPSA